jgi:stress response protein SCP2
MVSLTKGQKVNLTKDNPGLASLTIGLGWDAKRSIGRIFSSGSGNFDCDAAAILLKNGHFVSPNDLVYFGNLEHKYAAVKHGGDNLTGKGDGDDEQIFVNLAGIPDEYDRIVFAVNIYNALQRDQHFGMIKNAFIRVVDGNSGAELYRYNLTDNYNGKIAMLFGEVYRHNGEWKFSALGEGINEKSLQDIAKRFA